MITDNVFRSRDLSESALLLALGQKIIRVDKVGSICWFTFEDQDKCQEISRQFWYGHCLVDAKKYYDSLTRLKNRIFSLQ